MLSLIFFLAPPPPPQISNGPLSKLREFFRVVTTRAENRVCKIWFNWLIDNPRNSIILVDEFNVNLTIDDV